jgi:hypothetical protein
MAVTWKKVAYSDDVVGLVNAAGLTLADAKSLQLYRVLGSDATFSGITFTGAAGEALTEGQLVYQKNDGKYWKTDADAAATMPCIAMSTAQIAENATGVFMLEGFMRFDDWTWTDEGVSLFASGTAGGMTETAPTGANTIIQKVATVIAIAATGSKDIVYFRAAANKLMDSPANGILNCAPTANWAYDHDVATTGVHGVGAGTVAKTSDIPAANVTCIKKAAAETVNNSNVMQNDDDFVWTVEANHFYECRMFIIFSSGTTPDFKYWFNATNDADARWIDSGVIGSSTDGNTMTYKTHNDGHTSTIAGTGGYVCFCILASFNGNAQGGVINWQWAQNTANVSNTIVDSWSYAILTNITG